MPLLHAFSRPPNPAAQASTRLASPRLISPTTPPRFHFRSPRPFVAEENWAERERYVLPVPGEDPAGVDERLEIEDVAAILRPAMAEILGPDADVDGAASKVARQILEVCGEVEWTNTDGKEVERLDPLGAPMIAKRASLGKGGWRAMSINNRVGHLGKSATDSFHAADERTRQIVELSGQVEKLQIGQQAMRRQIEDHQLTQDQHLAQVVAQLSRLDRYIRDPARAAAASGIVGGGGFGGFTGDFRGSDILGRGESGHSQWAFRDRRGSMNSGDETQSVREGPAKVVPVVSFKTGPPTVAPLHIPHQEAEEALRSDGTNGEASVGHVGRMVHADQSAEGQSGGAGGAAASPANGEGAAAFRHAPISAAQMWAMEDEKRRTTAQSSDSGAEDAEQTVAAAGAGTGTGAAGRARPAAATAAYHGSAMASARSILLSGAVPARRGEEQQLQPPPPPSPPWAVVGEGGSPPPSPAAATEAEQPSPPPPSSQ